ncbi:MAG: hypothetical protein ACUVWZ_14125, partial [Anaerolineae bacterium]
GQPRTGAVGARHAVPRMGVGMGEVHAADARPKVRQPPTSMGCMFYGAQKLNAPQRPVGRWRSVAQQARQLPWTGTSATAPPAAALVRRKVPGSIGSPLWWAGPLAS